MIVEGAAWVFGDGIDTDVLAPGYAMKKSPEGLAQHCLEAVDPNFAKLVKPGDIVVGGANFGLGSSREQAAMVLATLGVGAVLAKSFARIFYRNAINIGLPVVAIDLTDRVAAGELLRLDLSNGNICLLKDGSEHAFQPMPSHIIDLVNAGGLMAQLKQRMGQ
ncbi:MAG: 3-isopropylmalate dehydratase [Erythrobacter sp.]|uniref:LeuD/DmdB family oxidoreductase small subunit n=1 Tax=Erythrobacter sp. TaxID=1042 RepID=UPI0032972967